MKKTYRGKKITNSKILARFIAHELRNSELENLHAEWPEFADEEMRKLMLEFERILESCFSFLQNQKLITCNLDKTFSILTPSEKEKVEKLNSGEMTFREAYTKMFFGKNGISWDDPTLDKTSK